MAKVSRDMLKTLVKECLFEILLESTGDTGANLMESRARPRPTSKKTGLKNRKLRPSLDNITVGKKDHRKMEASHVATPRPIDVSGITADPVLASIFQDTASTTLLEQNAAERGRAGAPLGPGVSLDDPAPGQGSLLGEASKNWAYLAFNDKSE